MRSHAHGRSNAASHSIECVDGPEGRSRHVYLRSQDPEWVGCAPVVFLGLIRNVLSLLASVDADRVTVLPSLRTPPVARVTHALSCDAVHWERLRLLSAVVARLYGPRAFRPAHQADEPLPPLARDVDAKQDTAGGQRAGGHDRSTSVVIASGLSPPECASITFDALPPWLSDWMVHNPTGRLRANRHRCSVRNGELSQNVPTALTRRVEPLWHNNIDSLMGCSMV
jgi:hypothetical protein